MDDLFLKSFIQRYNKDKEEFDKKFDSLNKKLQSIDNKFEDFDTGMKKLDKCLSGIEDVQKFMLGEFTGISDRLENVKVYLSSIETKLNEYKTLNIEGQKSLNGELYLLKIKLFKVKPIINWEGNEGLTNKYKDIEKEFSKIEENLETGTEN